MKVASARGYRGLELSLELEPLNCGHHLHFTGYGSDDARKVLQCGVTIEYGSTPVELAQLIDYVTLKIEAVRYAWSSRFDAAKPMHGWAHNGVAMSLMYALPPIGLPEAGTLDLEAIAGEDVRAFGYFLRGTFTKPDETVVALSATCFDPSGEATGFFDALKWLAHAHKPIAAAMQKVPPGDDAGNIWKRNGGGYHFHHINSVKPEAEEAFELTGGAA